MSIRSRLAALVLLAAVLPAAGDGIQNPASNPLPISQGGTGVTSGVRIPIMFGNGNQAQNVTNYTVPGSSNTSQNVGVAAPVAGTFRNLTVAANNAPAASNPFTVTLYTGTMGSLSPTALTCAISNPAKTCADSSDTVTIAAGGYWAIQMVTAASSGGTGVWSVSMELDE